MSYELRKRQMLMSVISIMGVISIMSVINNTRRTVDCFKQRTQK